MKEIFKKIVLLILTWEARIILKKYRPRVVGVTGSVGKTSSKDAIASVLGQKYNVRKSAKSLNSEFGVPLTILGEASGWDSASEWAGILWRGFLQIVQRAKYPEVLVLEVGADHPGDIQSIIAWLKPDVVVGTRMSEVPVHVEFFPDVASVVREKKYLADAVKEDGVLVLNADDKDIYSFKEGSKASIVSYGMSDRATVVGRHLQIMYSENIGTPEGIKFEIVYQGEVAPVSIKGILGEHVIYVALAGIATGIAEGLSLKEGVLGLKKLPIPPGRMQILEGIKESVVIDDSYNASPVALENALHALHVVKVKGRKIAVLGDMFELGFFSEKAHMLAGRQASLVCDVLIAVGSNARFFLQGAKDGGMDEQNIHSFKTVTEAIPCVEETLSPQDTILVKGSQGVRMERLVKALMKNPAQAQELLVRQEGEWEGR